MNRRQRKARYFKMLKLKFMLDELRRTITKILDRHTTEITSSLSLEDHTKIVAAAIAVMPSLKDK